MPTPSGCMLTKIKLLYDKTKVTSAMEYTEKHASELNSLYQLLKIPADCAFCAHNTMAAFATSSPTWPQNTLNQFPSLYTNVKKLNL